MTPLDLRRQLVDYIVAHADQVVNGRTISEWVDTDVGLSLDMYATYMALEHSPGGGIEIWAYSQMHRCAISVFGRVLLDSRRQTRRLEHLATYLSPSAMQRNHHILMYDGHLHYDNVERLGEEPRIAQNI